MKVPPYNPNKIQKACKALRERYPDLYALPLDHFRALVRVAVILGVRAGDFKDYSQFQLSEQDTETSPNR